MDDQQFIERKIIIGLITSTNFLKQIRGLYQNRLLNSPSAKRLATWCIEYFDRFKEAPGKNIEGIYFDKLKGLPKDIVEDIGGILEGLSKEYEEQSQTDQDYLISQSKQYFASRHLEIHEEKLKALREEGNLMAATALARSFKGITQEEDLALNFATQNALQAVEKAFEESSVPLIAYPKALGRFLNSKLIRGGFVAFLASEKRGKSFFLMDMAIRSAYQGNKVAFFQAGDMTESAQIRRFCIHLSKTSDREEYCGRMLQPVPDCIFNQLNLCTKKERECNFGVFEDRFSEKDIRDSITKQDLEDAFRDNPDYKNCYNCEEYKFKPWGVPWVEEITVKEPLDVRQAKKVFRRYFIKENRPIMLSTHSNGTLTISKIKALLNEWEISQDFIPDVIIIDYADLLVPDSKMEFRHQQNEIWKNLRALSQEERGGKLPLLVTATQADANSYDKNLLTLGNFSEDKRKYGHVTSMLGLNQDPKGREKRIGMMRINEIVLREDEFNSNNVVYVLQNLKRGLPVIGSFF